MKDLFNAYVIVGILEAVNMKRIDNVSSFIRLILERYSGGKDAAPVFKAFDA